MVHQLFTEEKKLKKKKIMSEQSGLVPESGDVVLSPAATAEPQISASKNPQESNNTEEDRNFLNKEEEEEETSTVLEPSTLPWSGDKGEKPQINAGDGGWPEELVSEHEEPDTGISAGSLSEERSQPESDGKSKDKWRESMPEGERWRDDEVPHKGDSSLADDEEEEEEVEEESNWMPEKAALVFTPQVKIVRPASRELPEESRSFIEKVIERAPPTDSVPPVHVYPDWTEEDNKYHLCKDLCREKLKLILGTVAAGILFPLLVWAGYTFLPFDPPLLQSTPLRVVYTLHCAFFATIPILLGVLVQGVARLHYSVLEPLYNTSLLNKHVAVHWHFVHESLPLFVFYFLQLAVMATYVSQDLLKLVPLLTIIFAFGRLIYWLCLALGSAVRGFGFGFSFFPILVMLGANLYFICSAVGHNAVFDVGPPLTPPPKQWAWG
ncbi:transmembrane protein 79-like [Thalassophryne amazonica]|uniref:transmembrane protein 79-like n=1 Tax=Thalassophryne amazonica TaxID=390379 RepID=UPI001470BE67|nr:transmembrane protein 79-like [Thalassophryne amazonica]XP_034017027.1 transmembrane protein 79-like [Thalassophryne amazonica]